MAPSRPIAAGAPALLLLLCLFAACGDRSPFWDDPLALEGPVVAADRIAFLDRTAARLLWIEPGDEGPPHSTAVSGAPRAFAPWGQGVLVLAGRGEWPVVDRIRLPGGARDSIPIDAPWDRIAVSPGGDRALLHYAADVQPAPGTAPVRNPNHVGILDPESGRVEALLLATESLAVRGALFSADGSTLAILFDNAVALIDTARPERRAVVPLKLRDGSALRPIEAHFTPSGKHLFVRATGSDEVIALEPIREGEELSVSLNFLSEPGASGLLAIAVAEPLGERVVALYRERVALLDASGDPAGNRSASLPAGPDSILHLGDGLLLLHAGPGSGVGDRLAVAAWEPLADRLVVDRLERSLSIGGAVLAGSAFLPQPGALTAASVERLAAGLRLRLQVLQLAGTPTAAIADEASGRVFVGLSLPIDPFEPPETGTAALASIEAGSFATDGLLLDERIVRLGVAGEQIFALHPGPQGDLTLVPATDLRRSAALRYDGIAFGGLLDRGEE